MKTTNDLPPFQRRLRVLVMVLVALSPLAGLSACIQDSTVFAPFSVVNIKVVPTGNLPIAGIRMSLTASGLTPGDNDTAFTDTSGFATIRTQKTGFHYVVARHALLDVSYGGLAANLTLGGTLQVFQRGRINITDMNQSVTPDFLFPFTGNAAPPQVAPKQLGLRPKIPGKARFIFFVEDGNVIRHTLAPDNPPMPSGKVFVTGDWNGFSLTTEDVDPVNGAKELVDDGSVQFPNADDQLGDGVFTRVLDLSPGIHTYAFLQNGVGIYTRDPYEEFSKPVRVAVRTPDNSIGNPREEEIREFTASAITVTADPNAVQN